MNIHFFAYRALDRVRLVVQRHHSLENDEERGQKKRNREKEVRDRGKAEQKQGTESRAAGGERDTEKGSQHS